jgi:hypothetical protein
MDFFLVDGQTPDLDSELPATESLATAEKDISFDQDGPQVAIDNELALNTIIVHLRRELDNVTVSYDAALAKLGELHSEHARLQAASSDSCDEINFLQCRIAELAAQVEAERGLKQRAEAESQETKEAISVLRQQLQESRKAIMRLQAEARQSDRLQKRHTTLIAGLPGHVAAEGRPVSIIGAGGSASAPITRTLSNSDRDVEEGAENEVPETRRRSLHIQDTTLALSRTSGQGDLASRRGRRHFSVLDLGLPGMVLEPTGSQSDVSPFAVYASPTVDEFTALRTQVDVLRQQLADATEAREASDTCLKALREMVLDSTSSGEASMLSSFKGISLPPLPCDVDASSTFPTASAGRRPPTSRWSLLSSLGRPRAPQASPAEEKSVTSRVAESSDLSSRALALVGLGKGCRPRAVSPTSSSGGFSQDSQDSLSDSPPSLSDGGDASSAPLSAFSSPRHEGDIWSHLATSSTSSSSGGSFDISADARKSIATCGPEILRLDEHALGQLGEALV